MLTKFEFINVRVSGQARPNQVSLFPKARLLQRCCLLAVWTEASVLRGRRLGGRSLRTTGRGTVAPWP